MCLESQKHQPLFSKYLMSRQGHIHSFWNIRYTTASSGSCFTLWKKTLLFQTRTMNEKNPSEGEEYAKLLLGYIKLRIDPTVLKFLPDFTQSLQEPESQTCFSFNSFTQFQRFLLHLLCITGITFLFSLNWPFLNIILQLQATSL